MYLDHPTRSVPRGDALDAVTRLMWISIQKRSESRTYFGSSRSTAVILPANRLRSRVLAGVRAHYQVTLRNAVTLTLEVP